MVEDALASNGPHIELLGKLDMRFILGAKPGGREPEVRAFLFEWVDNTPGTRAAEFAGEDGVRHRFRWLNGAPLNDANFDLEVNFLEYREITPEGPGGQGPALLVGDGPAGRRGQPDGADARRAGALAACR